MHQPSAHGPPASHHAELTRIGDGIQSARGDTTLTISLDEKPPALFYSPHGAITYGGIIAGDDLRRLPSRSQITHQACEEGWSFIAEWAGVPLAALLDVVWVRPEARWVVFYPFDTFWDSIDMAEARHPQTLLAYSMNGRDLAPGHGAPLRVRVPRQLGYKSIKYLSRITLVDSLDHVGNGKGSLSPDVGYSWYAGI